MNIPLNYTIWVTANNYTWFPVRVVYESDSAVVYQNCREGSAKTDIARNYPFSSIFRQWKFVLDGTEQEVSF